MQHENTSLSVWNKHRAIPIRNKSGFVSGDQFADLMVNQFTKYIISQSTILQITVSESTISQTIILFCYAKYCKPINSTALQAHFFKKSPYGNL